jgi:acetate kinase
MNVLVLNSGSSSIKFQLIDTKKEEVLVKGRCDAIGLSNAYLLVGKKEIKQPIKNHVEGMKLILDVIKEFKIDAIGHRVVHGAEFFKTSTKITPQVLEKIESCSDLAPLHNPHNITGIKACEKAMPKINQVAVFDTSFHQSISKEVFLYGIPYEYYQKYAIRKYGFHGTSHQFITNEVEKILNKKKVNIINCHLGNGASVCAIKESKSIDTSMGFTPIAGVMMGTRCGDVDLGIVPFLSAKENKNIKEILEIFNNKSGLKGIAGESDVRTLREGIAKGNKQFELAINVFAYKVALYIGAYYSILPNIDAITFTAGIGENESFVREKILNNLSGLGIIIDDKANKENKQIITTNNSKVKVMVIGTNEELMIAEETERVLKEK